MSKSGLNSIVLDLETADSSIPYSICQIGQAFLPLSNQ